MNILLISHYAGSVSMGMAFRPYYFAKEWQKSGHNVRIVCASYSHQRIKNPEVKKDFEVLKIDGVEYQCIKTGEYSGNGVKRAITMFEFCSKLYLNAKRIVKDFSPDLVISSSTYPMDSYPAKRIAKFAKAKYVHEAHDLWPLTLIEIGGMSRLNPFVIIMGIAENYALKNAEKVVSILPNTLEHMKRHKLGDEKKFLAISNGIDSDDWNGTFVESETTEFLDKLHEEGRFIIGYVGGHNISNALYQLLQSAQKFKDRKDIAFVFVGNGSEKNNIVAYAEDNEIDNVYFLDPVKKTEVPSILNKMDSLYIGAKNCSLYRYGISMNKIYDYMMASKPILYGVVASNNDIETAGCGISFNSANLDEFVNAINEMLSLSDEERRKMGENGHKWVVENCLYSVLAKRFIDEVMAD